MSQNYYNLYINNTLDLAQTIVIKSEESADAINNYLKLVYGDAIVDPYNPDTWKYYQNICGKYHITDDVITITSLDTLEKITFSTENLKVHRATSKAYQFGTRHYIELLALYPKQEQLILGILYPATMEYALSSKDGTILSYPSYLVESNEITLIEKLNKAIEVYKVRWHNPQFTLTDSLYSAAHLGLLYLYLVPTILNLRLAACKTNEAHSYHVRQYLASHGMLDVYIDTMTLKQTLFLYRNITYIERNSGKQEVFEWLTQHIMTERNLPLSEYTMRHSEVDMLENLYPTVSFRKKLINTNAVKSLEGSFTLRQILDKEEYEDSGNKDYREEHEPKILMTLNNSLSSVLKTKLLESSIVDYTDATPYTMQSILLNEWLDLSNKNIYNVYISFTDPRVGNKLTLIASDAYIYLMYVFARSIGSNIDRIPSFIALRTQRIPAPTVQELMSIVDKNYIDESVAKQLIYDQPEIPPDKPIVSVEAFYNLSTRIYNACQNQIKLMGNQEHHYRRGLVYNMITHMYQDSTVHFADEGTLYTDWLINKEMPLTEFTNSEYQALYKSIYEAATGSALSSTATLANLQKSMLNIMKQLSSYTVQFVSEINDSNIKVLNWGVIRLGDRKYQQLAENHVENIVDVIAVDGFSDLAVKYNLSLPDIFETEKATQQSSFDIDFKVKPKLTSDSGYSESRYLQIPRFQLTAQKDGVDSIGNFVGYHDFGLLSTSDKKSLKSIY